MPNRKVIIKKFDTPLDFLEWATSAPCVWRGRLASKEGTYSFTGTHSYEEAYNLAKFGWPEGVKMLKKEVEIAENILTPDKKPRKRFDVYGYRASPERAAAGEAFNMIRKGKTIKKRPIIKIRTNMTFNASTSREHVMRWGAAICSYVNMLERQGQSVELTNVYESESNGPSVSFQFKLKAAEEKLSLASIVFWWAHPSSLRRIEFAADEKLDIEEWFGQGYGRHKNVTPVDDDTLFLSINDAGYSMEENLEIIRKKHEKLLQRLDSQKPSARSAQYRR